MGSAENTVDRELQLNNLMQNIVMLQEAKKVVLSETNG